MGQELRTKPSPKQAKEENDVNARLALVLVLALAMILSGCNQGGSPTPAVTETAAQTEMAVPTQTAIPTATPTEVPTATATPVPTVWDIAQTMLAECVGSTNAAGVRGIEESYANSLSAAAVSMVPQLADSQKWLIRSMTNLLPNDGVNPSPFANANRPSWNYWWKGASYCDGYVLVYENIPENNDGDGILVGEAYLFYVTLNGQFKEVHYAFPPAP